MNTKNPKLVALEFNECINRQDLDGLSRLMTDDHTFIDRDGKVVQPRKVMIESWKQFFESFPEYKNTFTRVKSKGNLVVMLGHAFWSQEQPYDPAIWTASIRDDLVCEWRIYADTEANRKAFNLV
jgi:predicted SnoaL-like aldol condensation-catalyzing enzyme